MYIRYFFFTIALILFKILCWLPPVAIFNALVASTFKLDKLPGIWSWFHTHDDNIYGANFRRAHENDPEVIPAKFVKRFKSAIWWLYRNPGYGFSAYVLGYPASAPSTVVYGLYKFTAADGTKLWSYRTESGKFYGWKPHVLAGRHMIVFRFWK